MTSKSELFDELDKVISRSIGASRTPQSLSALTDQSIKVLKAHYDNVADPARYIVENFSENEGLNAKLRALIFNEASKEAEERVVRSLVRQFADNFEAKMTDLTNQIKDHLAKCGSLGERVSSSIDKAMKNPRANIQTLSICLEQAPGLVGRLSSQDRGELLAIARPFRDAMAHGLADVLASEANLALATPTGPYPRYVWCDRTDDVAIAGEPESVRFVYDTVDDELIFNQALWEGRWGSTNTEDNEMISEWVKANLATSLPLERLEWQGGDDVPDWARLNFMFVGRG